MMPDNQPYGHQWYMHYFETTIAHSDTGKFTSVRFKRNRFTGSVYVFRFNCADTGNRWNEHGYGWGRWEKLARSSKNFTDSKK